MTNHKIAVIGCGYWGKNLVRNFAALDALEMICDVADGGRHVAKELAPEAKLVTQYGEVLHSDVEGVVIATPAITHYHLAHQALEAGKDVFVEKPLAVSYDEGARRKNCLLLLRMGRSARYSTSIQIGSVLARYVGKRTSCGALLLMISPLFFVSWGVCRFRSSRAAADMFNRISQM